MMHANDGQVTPRTQHLLNAETVSIAASESLKSLCLAELYLKRDGYTADAERLLEVLREELKQLHKAANAELGVD